MKPICNGCQWNKVGHCQRTILNLASVERHHLSCPEEIELLIKDESMPMLINYKGLFIEILKTINKRIEEIPEKDRGFLV